MRESKDTWRDKIALCLWRDSYERDPAYGTVTHEHLSLKGRISKARKALAEWERSRQSWLVPLVISTSVAMLTLWLARGDLSLTEPSQQVNANTGELLLRCTQQGDQILRCIPLKK